MYKKTYVSLLSILLLCTFCTKPHIPQKGTTVPLGYVPFPQNGYGSAPDQLGQPDDVEILSDGTMVVSDVDNNRIQVFNKDGKLVKSVTHRELGIEFSNILPTGISKDGKGYVYVTLEGAGRIARFNPQMEFDQFIGKPGRLTADNYYNNENSGIMMSPQGLICSTKGDVYVIDMTPDVFNTDKNHRSFRMRKFFPNVENGKTIFKEDLDFAHSQEITTLMHKSEGMALVENQGLLFVSEEKPTNTQFGNSEKKRFAAVFDMNTGKFTGKLLGVMMEDGKITSGNHDDSVEGLTVLGKYIFAVDEKKGTVFIYDIESRNLLAQFGERAYWYCDDESDCVIAGINYNEQSIIAGIAKPHLLNDWKNNELASPDGISAMTLTDGTHRLAVVDQWNSRILYYDLDALLAAFNLKIEN